MRHAARLALGVFLVALLAAGCSSNSAETKSSVTSSVTVACHDFGTKAIVHASSVTTAERLQLMDEMMAAQNQYLRTQASALRTAILHQDNAAQLTAGQNIARTCYNLGLLTKSGQPK